jgi:hypothetical protein
MLLDPAVLMASEEGQPAIMTLLVAQSSLGRLLN